MNSTSSGLGILPNTQADLLRNYRQVTRNFEAKDIVAIESGKPLSVDLLRDHRALKARYLWDQFQRSGEGAVS